MSDSPNRQKLYNEILELMNGDTRLVFDQLNKDNVPNWNEHSFDICYIIASYKTYEELEFLKDEYLLASFWSDRNLWSIFLEDEHFARTLDAIYKKNFNNLLEDEKSDLMTIISIFLNRYPDLFKSY